MERAVAVTAQVVLDLEAVERVALPDVPIPYARPLEEEVLPDVEDIVEAVKTTQ